MSKLNKFKHLTVLYTTGYKIEIKQFNKLGKILTYIIHELSVLKNKVLVSLKDVNLCTIISQSIKF